MESLSGLVRCLNSIVEQPIAKALGAIALAYAAYWFGLQSYLRQRRADQARLRFVENGIDDFAAQLDALLSVQRHNWQMMLRYLKLVRDAAESVVPEEFFRSLREVDARSFNIVAAHRVEDLTGERLFWIGYQKVYSFVATKADFIYGDFGSALRAIAVNRGQVDIDGFVGEAERAAREMGDAADPFYKFLSHVASIAALADAHVFDRGAAVAFKNREDVRKIVNELKKEFPDWQMG